MPWVVWSRADEELVRQGGFIVSVIRRAAVRSGYCSTIPVQVTAEQSILF